MRTINLIMVHCSATREDCTPSPEGLGRLHRRCGFSGTGYHYYIRKDGAVYLTRSLEHIGVHTKDFNTHSIGICYEGGLDCRGCPTDTRTSAQRATLRQLVRQPQEKFPGCRVYGHRDLSPGLNGNGEIEPEKRTKQYPCFGVAKGFNKFGAFISRTDETRNTKKHRVTQRIKKQKGGK